MGSRLRLLAVLVSLIFYTENIFSQEKNFFEKKQIELSYKNKKKLITVELAENQQQHAQGLMFREKLNKDEGMLFVFQDEQIREFWMKNTIIDLDIGYFDSQKTLVDIQQMKAVNSVLQKDIPTYPSKKPAQFALEMSKGWFKKQGFLIGTKLKLTTRPTSENKKKN